MRVSETTRVTCPACESPQTGPYLSGHGDRGRDIERPFTYFLCSRCRLRFQCTTPEEARGLYADVQDLARSICPTARRELRCDEDAIRKFVKFLTGRRLLDVGSGDGWFLDAARNAGFDCTGIDVSERLAEVARRRSRVPVLVGELADLDLPPASFDLINLDAVLMYVANPRSLIHQVARLLRPGGICRIREFDADSLAARVKGKSYWMYAPTHVNVWTGKSIRAIAVAASLNVFRVIPGTEASLFSWLAASRSGGVLRQARDIVRFLTRKIHVLNIRIGAETVYYLRKTAQDQQFAKVE
jgi:SAM-dependent methyltransferase